MSLVEKVKQLCETNGTTLTALERELGFSGSSIRKWDESAPSTDKVKAVADRFDVSVDYLIGREPSDEVEEMLEYLHKSPEMRILLSSSAKLEKEDLDAVVAIVKRMNKERDMD